MSSLFHAFLPPREGEAGNPLIGIMSNNNNNKN
jgi:hypothetical protein